VAALESRLSKMPVGKSGLVIAVMHVATTPKGRRVLRKTTRPPSKIRTIVDLTKASPEQIRQAMNDPQTKFVRVVRLYTIKRFKGKLPDARTGKMNTYNKKGFSLQQVTKKLAKRARAGAMASAADFAEASDASVGGGRRKSRKRSRSRSRSAAQRPKGKKIRSEASRQRIRRELFGESFAKSDRSKDRSHGSASKGPQRKHSSGSRVRASPKTHRMTISTTKPLGSSKSWDNMVANCVRHIGKHGPGTWFVDMNNIRVDLAFGDGFNPDAVLRRIQAAVDNGLYGKYNLRLA